jgi:hypothetical protein
VRNALFHPDFFLVGQLSRTPQNNFSLSGIQVDGFWLRSLNFLALRSRSFLAFLRRALDGCGLRLLNNLPTVLLSRQLIQLIVHCSINAVYTHNTLRIIAQIIPIASEYFLERDHAVVLIRVPVAIFPEAATGCAGDCTFWVCAMLSTALLISSPASCGCSLAARSTEPPNETFEGELPVICIVDS